MPLQYKIDILEALKKNGYSTFRLRKEGLLSESTIQKLRENADEPLSWKNIDTICELLNMQPSDFIEHISWKENAIIADSRLKKHS